MKKKSLAILIAALGVACLVCGGLLLFQQPKPTTVNPAPSASPTASPTAEPTVQPTEEPQSSQPVASEEPYVSPIDFASLQEQNPDIYGWLRIPQHGV